MNTVNLPLALFTVIVRRFIDKLRTPQGAVIIRTAAPWVMDTSFFKPCMYAYMFFTGVYYTIRHMQRGTIVNLARKCSDSAGSIRERCVRRRNAMNRMSVMNNLLNDREGQQQALRCVVSMTPHESMILPEPILVPSRSDMEIPERCQNFRPEINYGQNPYYEPVNRIAQQKCHNVRCRRRNQMQQVDTIMEPKSQCFKEETPVQVNKPEVSPMSGDTKTFNNSDPIIIDSSPSKEMIPSVESLDLSESPQFVDLPQTSEVARRKPRQRNCLTLRGRKVIKNDLNYSNRVVRKTRSGRVYGCENGIKRPYNRKKT